MLLRIDVYHNNDEAPTQTLFVSPATVKNREDSTSSLQEGDAGRLLSVGRKECEVLFDQEKAVSRKHAVLRIASNDPQHQLGCKEAITEEEVEACENNPLGMCLILENIGKGGSFVILPDSKDQDGKKRGHSNDNKEQDATDDETDDEGVVSQPTSQALSTATGGGAEGMANSAKFFYGNTSLIVSRLEVGDKKVLSFEGTKDNSIFVQFAISPSRPAIRISWLPLRMVCSSTVPKTIKSSLYLGGAIPVDGLPDQSTTHLVAKEYGAVAKQLVAWCRGIPIVSPEFCKTLIERKDITQPLPDPKDFAAAKAEGFWLDTPNPKLFSSFRILSVLPTSEDVELLVKAAGATVVRLPDIFSKDTDIMNHVESLMKDTTQPSMILAVLALAGNKKGVKAKMPLYNKIINLGIPAINIKEVARAITEQSSALKDIHHNVIPGAEEDEADGAKSEMDLEETDQEEELHKKQESTDGRDSPIEINESRNKQKERELTAKGQRVAERSEQIGGIDPVGDTPEEIECLVPLEKPRDSSRPRVSLGHAAQLEAANFKGWFAVAPKDAAKRKAFRKKASQAIQKDGGIGLEQPAATASVVQIITPTESRPSADDQTSFRRTNRGLVFGRIPRPNYGGPNFKRFRKNYTAPVDPEEVVVLVDFVSEETQKQREMNEQARKLQEEQREADALFGGMGTAGAPKKRRRKD